MSFHPHTLEITFYFMSKNLITVGTVYKWNHANLCSFVSGLFHLAPWWSKFWYGWWWWSHHNVDGLDFTDRSPSNWSFLNVYQFSYSVVSDSLRPHESQHARLPCPSPSPGVHPNSCPLSRWCHPAISSSIVPFFSCPQSLPASESFPMSQLFAWGSQSIGVSASASVLPTNNQDWSPSEWTGWISLQSKGLSRVFSSTTVHKHQFFMKESSAFFTVQLSHRYMTTGKTIALTRWTFVGKVMSLLFNMLSSWL